MAAVIGIDLGNETAVLAAAQKRGIDVLTNETSRRQTPMMVALAQGEGSKRELGEAALTQQMRNIRGTATCLRRLVGRKFDAPEVQAELKMAGFAGIAMPDGTVGIRASDGETYSVTQLLGMSLGHLKRTAERSLDGRDVRDVVLSIPGWYPDSQRRAVLDAASIAGLNCVRLIEDHVATALAYGIYKKDLPDPVELKDAFKPKHVMFVDIGESDTSVCIAAMQKGKLVIESVSFDAHLGGRDVDTLLLDHFVKEFSAKYKLDIAGNARALVRMRAGCEKLKKVVNSTPKAPLNIECLMEDTDVRGELEREQMFEMCKEVANRLEAPLLDALARAGLTAKDLDSVEIVGGSSRFVPFLDKIKAVLGVETISTTMNADECVARGAALQAAILSPVFRVREFEIEHTIPYPIEFGWMGVDADVNGPLDESVPVFWDKADAAADIKRTLIPARKKGVSTFLTTGIKFVARYSADAKLPGGVDRFIGSYTAQELPAAPAGLVPTESGARKVTAKVHVDLHGTFRVTGVIVSDNVEETLKVPVEKAAGETEMKDAPAADAKAEPETTTKVVKKATTTAVSYVTVDTGLTPAQLNLATEVEAHLHAADRLVIETAEARNSVEEYVYNMRDNLVDGGSLHPFIEPQLLQPYLAQLQGTEDWLYGEGEGQTKSVYTAKLAELQKVGGPVKARSLEAFNRFDASKSFRAAAQAHKVWAETANTDPKYEHIEAAQLQKVVAECDRVLGDVESKLAQQESRPKYEEVLITCAQLEKAKQALADFVRPIQNAPKPKPKVEVRKDGQKDGDAKPETPAAEEPKSAEEPMPDAPKTDASAEKVEMDLD